MKLFFQTGDGKERTFVGPICPSPFPTHVHVVCEFVYLSRGSATLTVGSVTYKLEPGDSIAVFPSVAHSYDEVSPDAEGLCLIFSPDLFSESIVLFRSMRPSVPVLRAADAPKDLHYSADTMKELIKVHDLESPMVVSYMHVFVAHMLSALNLQPLDKDVDTSLVQQVLQYVADHFKDPLTLDSVSMALGISKSNLSHLFSDQLNINFRKYINILRVDEACRLLKTTDLTVTEICYACGYNNLRTFHRAFLDETTIQPNDFRAKVNFLKVPVKTVNPPPAAQD